MKFEEIQKRYVYIKLSFFQKNTSFQMYKKIKDFQDANHEKMKGMILDLRDNPGGLLDEAIKVSSLFLENQMIVSIEGRDYKQIEEVRSSSGKNALNDFPIIVLVNKGTASSSEIVAGALQDSGRAIVMGSETYGKSTIQDVISLPNGGAIKITTAKYHIPNTKGLQKNTAILPDIPFDFSRNQGLSAEQEIQIAYDHLVENENNH
jgi:carboxyl-terminal processing protease